MSETNFAMDINGGNGRQDGFEYTGLTRLLLCVVYGNDDPLLFYLSVASPWDWRTEVNIIQSTVGHPKLTFSPMVAPVGVSVIYTCSNGEIESICFNIALNVAHFQTQCLGSTLHW